MRILIIAMVFLPLVSSAQITGDWFSGFVVMGITANIKMEISETSPSTLYLTEIDGAFGPVLIEDHKIDGDTLRFTWATIGLSYNGTYSDEEKSIIGTMSQHGITWDVVFTKEQGERVTVNRPQEPKGPFNYSNENIQIKNGEIVLGATLTLPKNFSQSTKIVVLASGSGAQNRDCEIMGHKMFLVIADYLATHGIGSLRFDDRGVGESTGDYANSSVSDFGTDVVSCVKYLRKTKNFKKNKIGVCGHSEGGMHTLIAATTYRKIDFILQLSSVGTSGAEVLIEQQYLIPKQSGEKEEVALWNRSVYEGIVRILSRYDQKEAADSLTIFLGQKYDDGPQEYKEITPKMSFILGLNIFLNNDWGREFIKFKTPDYLKKLKIPLFAGTGSKDIQVPSVSNLAGFNKYRGASSQISSFDGLNHLLQVCEVCTVGEYGELEQTISPDVLETIFEWLNAL